MKTSLNLTSYLTCSSVPLSHFESIEKEVETIKDLLEKEILCPHDINNLSQAYQHLDQLEQKDALIPQENSETILCTVIDKLKTAYRESSSAKQIITAYYLQKFEISLLNKTFTPHFDLPKLTDAKIKDIATHLPFCGEKLDLEADVEALLGKDLQKEVMNLIQTKKDHIDRREKIRERFPELQELREKDSLLYPSYLEEILEGGFFHLYDHLIKMKKLPTQAEREIQEKDLSCSTFSHIVLEFKEATLAKTQELIPAGSNILFLLGDTGSGKSTTLCYLRKDRMILQNNNYQSLASDEGLIGNNGEVSCTLFPNITTSSDLTLVDFPGFNDTHGKVIALAIELSLRALVKKYSPQVLILSSITDTESRFNHALRLGERLKRILGTLDHCILGLTKYSKDPDFIEIKNIEIQQHRQFEKLSSPSSEESELEGGINVLLSLIEEMPNLQNELDQKKEKQSQLKAKRISLLKKLLPDTAEKKQHFQNLSEKENVFKEKMGIKKMISLADLTDETERGNLLNTFKLSYNALSLPKYHQLDPVDKYFLSEFFKNKIIDLIISVQDPNLSSSVANSSQEALFKLDRFKAFEESVAKTSLISTLLLTSNPEIGQFFHLEEMDPTIIASYDQDIIESCIRDYTNHMISDCIVIEKVIEKFKEELQQNPNQEINTNLTLVKNHIIRLSTGGPESQDEANVHQVWDDLRKDYESRINTQKAGLKLSKSKSITLIAAFGLPYAIFLFIKNYKIKNIRNKVVTEIAEMLCDWAENISQIVQLLTRVQTTVKNKIYFDETILNTLALLESPSSLDTSLNQ